MDLLEKIKELNELGIKKGAKIKGLNNNDIVEITSDLKVVKSFGSEEEIAADVDNDFEIVENFCIFSDDKLQVKLTRKK